MKINDLYIIIDETSSIIYEITKISETNRMYYDMLIIYVNGKIRKDSGGVTLSDDGKTNFFSKDKRIIDAEIELRETIKRIFKNVS